MIIITIVTCAKPLSQIEIDAAFYFSTKIVCFRNNNSVCQVHTIHTLVFPPLKYRNTSIYNNKIAGGIHVWHFVSRLFTAIILLFFIECSFSCIIVYIQTLHYLLRCLRSMIKVCTNLREILGNWESSLYEKTCNEYPTRPPSLRLFADLVFRIVWHILFIHVYYTYQRRKSSSRNLWIIRNTVRRCRRFTILYVKCRSIQYTRI